MPGLALKVALSKDKAMQKLHKAAALAKMLSISRSTLWRWCKNKVDFPQPRKISQGVTAWSVGEIEEWLNSQKPKEVPVMEQK